MSSPVGGWHRENAPYPESSFAPDPKFQGSPASRCCTQSKPRKCRMYVAIIPRPGCDSAVACRRCRKFRVQASAVVSCKAIRFSAYVDRKRVLTVARRLKFHSDRALAARNNVDICLASTGHHGTGRRVFHPRRRVKRRILSPTACASGCRRPTKSNFTWVCSCLTAVLAREQDGRYRKNIGRPKTHHASPMTVPIALGFQIYNIEYCFKTLTRQDREASIAATI